MELAAQPRLTSLVTAPPADKERTRVRTNRRLFVGTTLCALLILGIFLRVCLSPGFQHVGYDEHRYVVFLKQIQRVGLLNYDAVVHFYVEQQYQRPDAVVPATRVGFLVPAYLVGQLFHLPPFAALRTTACGASILLLGLGSLVGFRMGGSRLMLAMTLLLATAPLQIYLAQRALIDGYFAFWAVASLYLTWENMQRPGRWPFLLIYTLCLTMLVLTKENAAFVVFVILALLVINRWFPIGTVRVELVVATILGPAIALLFLALLVGGVTEWVHFYLMFIAKSRTNPYSVLAQDGPWYRYFVDFALLTPLVVVLVIGRIFQLRKVDRPEIFMTLVLLLSFISMSAVKYGMSLRYAAYWDVPLCLLAATQIISLSSKFTRVRPMLLMTGLLLVAGMAGLGQYYRFFVKGEIYDPVTAELVHAADMQKFAP